MTLGRDELERRLGYHPAGPATVPIYELNRAAALVLADLWDQVLPPGRETACALTALQEALMWANAAVACNLDPDTAVLPEVELGDYLETVLERVEGPTMTRSGSGSPHSGPDRPVERETVADALENDRCGVCGSVDHFREAHDHRREVAQLDVDDVPEQTR